MSDLRTRLLHVLIDSTPPQYLPPPNDLSRILDAVIAEMRPQLAAWARMCVDSGDMTPMAQRLLHNILGQA